jgi:hypothetical protein
VSALGQPAPEFECHPIVDGEQHRLLPGQPVE